MNMFITEYHPKRIAKIYVHDWHCVRCYNNNKIIRAAYVRIATRRPQDGKLEFASVCSSCLHSELFNRIVNWVPIFGTPYYADFFKKANGNRYKIKCSFPYKF